MNNKFHKSIKNLPIDLINKILQYAGELNNDTVIIQYETTSHKEYYKINFNSKFIKKLKNIIVIRKKWQNFELIYPSKLFWWYYNNEILYSIKK